MKLSDLYWHRITPLHFLLWPLSILYVIFLRLQKFCYWLDILPTIKLTVPVIVVDSISIEDSGKSSLIEWLAQCLLKQGYRPAIITRGNTDHHGKPHQVTTDCDPNEVGSKTFLLARHCGESCPVWIGNDRIDTARSLLAVHPQCNIIIYDGGVNCFRLERDLEIVVVDFSEHSFGNGLCLPAGPLRFDIKQLEKIDIVVTNDKSQHFIDSSNRRKSFNMKLLNNTAYPVFESTTRQPITEFKNKRLQAIATEDNALWMYNLIHCSGLNARLSTFPENHAFTPADIQQFRDAEIILMPEDNALLCQSFATDTLWALPRDAWINNELQTVILKRLQQVN